MMKYVLSNAQRLNAQPSMYVCMYISKYVEIRKKKKALQCPPVVKLHMYIHIVHTYEDRKQNRRVVAIGNMHNADDGGDVSVVWWEYGECECGVSMVSVV